MKVAELFAALGFKIEGADKLDRVDRSLESTERNAKRAAIGIGAITVAFLAMIDTSARAAQVLRNFAVSTGLSTDELQQWQHAAQVNGISADALTDSIKALQTARTNFALGEPQAVGAWSLLGVSPIQDPFKVLADLRARLGQIQDVGVARNLLSRVGLEGMIPLLRATDEEFRKWNSDLIVTKKQVQDLAKLNGAWQNLKTSVISLKTQFSALFVPVLVAVADGLSWVTTKAVAFVKWLQQAGPLSTTVRWVLQGMALVLLAVAAALAVIVPLVAFLGSAAGIAGIASLAAAFLPFLGTLSAIAAIIAGIILLVDDMWHAFTGGKSVLADLGDIVFGPVFRKLFELKDWLDAHVGWSATPNNFKMAPPPALTGSNFGNSFGNSFGRGASAPVKQDIKTEINIDGAKDPKAVGREVNGAMKQVLSGAAYQIPVPNY